MSRAFRFLILAALVAFAAPASADRTGDLAAARALFERNLQAIRDHDAEAYLACYRADEDLVRTGFGGPDAGYEAWAAEVRANDEWPTSIEASEVEVFAVTDGVVYGTYRYRVAYGETVREGISERVFLRTDDGWRIAVSTAFDAPEGRLTEPGSEDE